MIREVLHPHQALFVTPDLTPCRRWQASYSGMRMGFYEPVKQLLGATDPHNTPLHTKIIAGAITGTVGSAIANPCDLVKVRMQAVEGRRLACAGSDA